jgi:hypothetical protein
MTKRGNFFTEHGFAEAASSSIGMGINNAESAEMAAMELHH